jgi:hypothetical protein
MADLTCTTAQVAMVNPDFCETKEVVLAEAATAGQALYLTSSGTYGLADANAAGKQQIRGIALEAGGAGQGVTMLELGELYGYDLSGLAYDDLVYLSDTAGALADAAGTMTVQCGRVVPMPDSDKTKVLSFAIDRLREWS